LFGVGPGEFEDYEAKDAAEARRHAAWTVPHNAYTQMSSEAGIPALIFLLGGLVSAFRMLTRVARRARQDDRFLDIGMASYFTQIGMIAFCTSAFFLSLAYHFYFPAICGISIMISAVAEREFARVQPAASSAPGRL